MKYFYVVVCILMIAAIPTFSAGTVSSETKIILQVLFALIGVAGYNSFDV